MRMTPMVTIPISPLVCSVLTAFVLIGDKDREPNVKCSREVVAAVKARKLGAELKIYVGVHHVFNRKSGRLCERRNWCYNPEATADAQKRTIAFFAARLKGK